MTSQLTGTARTMRSPALSLAEPRARAFAAFQQELIEVAIAADGGDGAAQARLASWTSVAKQRVSEIATLSVATSVGDVAAIQRLQVIQAELMKEWVNAAASESEYRSRKSMS